MMYFQIKKIDAIQVEEATEFSRSGKLQGELKSKGTLGHLLG